MLKQTTVPTPRPPLRGASVGHVIAQVGMHDSIFLLPHGGGRRGAPRFATEGPQIPGCASIVSTSFGGIDHAG